MAAWHALAGVRGPAQPAPPAAMPPVLEPGQFSPHKVPPGYRRCGAQALRVDLAERLLFAAHRRRVAGPGRVQLDPGMARGWGLSGASFAALLHEAGFRVTMPRALGPGEEGPPAPPLWHWRAPRRAASPAAPVLPPPPGHAFAALAGLVQP
jgi:ATP-dependent RNA helicase SUPV3L1/SUV3